MEATHRTAQSSLSFANQSLCGGVHRQWSFWRASVEPDHSGAATVSDVWTRTGARLKGISAPDDSLPRHLNEPAKADRSSAFLKSIADTLAIQGTYFLASCQK